jgi:hypothetical protein
LCRFAALIVGIRLIDEKARECERPMWDHTLNKNPDNCVKFDGKALEAFVAKFGDKICAHYLC